jgi:hypothetical protein
MPRTNSSVTNAAGIPYIFSAAFLVVTMEACSMVCFDKLICVFYYSSPFYVLCTLFLVYVGNLIKPERSIFFHSCVKTHFVP